MPTVFIPASVRGPLYTVYAVVGIIAGALTVTFATMEQSQPTWLKVALSVYAFLGTAIGYVAASNTPSAPSEFAGKPYISGPVPPKS